MKKIMLSVAFVAAMVLGTTTYAQTPVKKEVKKEQTATCKKEAKGEKSTKTCNTKKAEKAPVTKDTKKK